jgi:hypothetical protein
LVATAKSSSTGEAKRVSDDDINNALSQADATLSTMQTEKNQEVTDTHIIHSPHQLPHTMCHMHVLCRCWMQ